MKNLRKIALIGWYIMLVSLILSIFETFYFHFKPSPLENICDILLLIINLIGCLFFAYAIIMNATIEIKKLIKKL